ncbi:hypothetical protein MM817_03273 [Acidibacillus sp. S0AB]|uniref:SAF domain-containing protein n=1 Tax=Sulfoacidibacillus ferrooxidans TaxID=2005001 RepID=A0A9X2AGE3_9BACL|nr:hypothetical protein [Sulfoacidibacillus ferrooxidans]
MTSKYLAPYETVTAQDVHTVTVPDSMGISGLATNMNQVVGTYLTFPIPKGYPVTAGDTSTSNSYSQFLTEYTDKTHQQGVMVSLSSNSPEAGLVTPGTKIALVVPSQHGSGGFQTIGPIEVLGVIRGNSPTLLLFVPTSQYETIMSGVVANNVSVEMIPQTGTFTLASDTQSMTIGQPTATRPLAHVTVDSTRHPKGA